MTTELTQTQTILLAARGHADVYLLRALAVVFPGQPEGLLTDAVMYDAGTQTRLSPAAVLHSLCCTHRLHRLKDLGTVTSCLFVIILSGLHILYI